MALVLFDKDMNAFNNDPLRTFHDGYSGEVFEEKFYIKNLDKTRLIIRHKKEITPETSGARTRHIQSLFIENEAGERFKYPYNHLSGARAMTRHVANGGTPHDDFGKHIIETSGNIAKLSSFKRYVQNKDFMNNTSSDIIEGAVGELESLRTHMKKLQTQSYYK